MKFKKSYKWLLYRFLEGSFLIFSGLRRSLSPYLFSRLMTPVLKFLIYFVVPRKRIIKNLGAAFGEAYSVATKKGLAKGVQEHFVKNLMDCFLQLDNSNYAREIVEIQGIENLDAALAKGNGVIALGAHIGNFVLLGARLGMEGYPFFTLFRLPPDQRIKSLIARTLPHFHQEIIPSLPKRVAVRQVLSALKKNEIVFILGDNLKKGKLQTLLFGQRVPSPRGPVSLALRSGAAVVPLHLIRNYQGGLHLIVEPEIPMTRNGSLSADIADNTQQIVRYLENLIRSYPDQWNWLTVRMKKYQAESGPQQPTTV
ncbi:MAG: lysophospholipid acyltransferase family protein [Candidatus Binatia bacterium]